MTRDSKSQPEGMQRWVTLWQRKMVTWLLAILFLPAGMVLLILVTVKLWRLAWPLILFVVLLLVIARVRRYLVGQSWRWK